MLRFANSWKLFKISWGVLRDDKSLAAFPVLSGAISLVVAGAFGGLIWLTSFEDATSATGTTSTSFQPIGYVFLGLMYLALAFVTVYFQSALTAAADSSLRGEDSTVRGGLHEANSRLGVILGWAVVIATVNVVLRAIQERFGFLGTIISSIFGAAWNIVTFLAVPVIVLEHAGPGKALKRSGTLLKQTWGENITAQIGFGLVGLVALLPAFALGGIAVALASVASIPFIVAGAVWALVVAIVLASLGGIYRVALYRFAVDRTPPAAFAAVDFEGAFAAKQRRGL